MKVFTILSIILLIILLVGLFYFLFNQQATNIAKSPILEEINESDDFAKEFNFYNINQNFLFSAEITKELKVEYIPLLKAINIYNPVLNGQNNVEKSQIYITFFRANDFLTLSTVDITRRDKEDVEGREAILYEITKKDGVPSFSGQPSWRNFKHKALDIRYSKDNPSYFYSFAQSPNLSDEIFNDFIDSLDFHPLVR